MKQPEKSKEMPEVEDKKPVQTIMPGIYPTLLASPTRCGKGISSVIPTLLSWSYAFEEYYENSIAKDKKDSRMEYAVKESVKGRNKPNK